MSLDDSALDTIQRSVATNTDACLAGGMPAAATSDGTSPLPPDSLAHSESQCGGSEHEQHEHSERSQSARGTSSSGAQAVPAAVSPTDSVGSGSTVSADEDIRPPSFAGSNADDILEEMTDSLTIIADYVRFRLRDELEYEWDDLGELADMPDKPCIMMRVAASTVLRDKATLFNDMITACRLTPSTAYPTFSRVVKELFKDGVVNWGRIVVLVAFTGALASYCVQMEHAELVADVTNWATWFMQSRLSQWISRNGGWAGFVQFYDQVPPSQQHAAQDWGNWGIAFTVGAAGAAALTRVLTK